MRISDLSSDVCSSGLTCDFEAYARASFAFDVLLGLDLGVDDNGIRVPERAVEWERAFPADMLVRLNAPLVRLDPDNDVVETEAFAIDPRTEQLVARQPAGNGIDRKSTRLNSSH